MLNIFVDYPSAREEEQILSSTTTGKTASLEKILNDRQILNMQKLIAAVPVSDYVIQYVSKLVRASRPGQNGGGLDFIKEYVNWGASPRAAQYLMLAGKARALLHGRFNVSTEDVQALAYPVMRHRILTNFHAESQRITTEEIIRRLLEAVPVPKSGLTN